MSEKTPHDHLVRQMLSQREVASAALRVLLPAEVSPGLRLDEAELQPGTFITKRLQRRPTDLLFKVPTSPPSPAGRLCSRP